MVLSRLCTVYYFAHFIILLPALSVFETPRSLPRSIGKSVLGGGNGPAPVPAAAGRNHDGSSKVLIILLLTVLVAVPIATTARSAESVAFRLRSGHLTGPSARSIEVNCKEVFKSTKKHARLVTL